MTFPLRRIALAPGIMYLLGGIIAVESRAMALSGAGEGTIGDNLEIMTRELIMIILLRKTMDSPTGQRFQQEGSIHARSGLRALSGAGDGIITVSLETELIPEGICLCRSELLRIGQPFLQEHTIPAD
jgi:hypothetical protein